MTDLSRPKRKEQNGTVFLEGCTYKSNQNLNQYAYWLLNGVTKIQIKDSYQQALCESVFKIPDLLIVTPGIYQCVIYKQFLTAQKYVSQSSEFVMQKGKTMCPSGLHFLFSPVYFTKLAL